MIIAFSGIDCAGKSTQIALLEERLRQESRSVEVRWYRPGYSQELDALRRLLRRRSSVLPPPGPGQARERAFSKPWVRGVWLTMATLDTLWTYGVRLRLARLLGRTIICDRYVSDAVLDLHLRFPERVALDGILSRLLHSLCPRPRLHVLLHLSIEEAQRRQREKREPFPDDERIFRVRHAAYAQWSADGPLTVIDASGGIDEVAAEIASLVPDVIG